MEVYKNVETLFIGDQEVRRSVSEVWTCNDGAKSYDTLRLGNVVSRMYRAAHNHQENPQQGVDVRFVNLTLR